ncbi:hypothetical protein GCM10010123_20090 [Pilimelia anulata]|uniref:Radical SAM core domain-containing protein n=1 Tax=Pilimelia anulata TaxID=53371 RepID=A0A8J3B2A2_9ACTN|nr:radical SAM protein [Pilimelia anulata]GGJ90280.1 hypothetical protein GCM10010123_20090 [Pilimelia anulata]
MSVLPEAVTVAPDLRLRHEHFGALAWRGRPRRIFNLHPAAVALVLLHHRSRPAAAPSPAVHVPGLDPITEAGWAEIVANLLHQDVLVAADERPTAVTAADLDGAGRTIAERRPALPVLKPMWVHLQPFTLCNQKCLHCYCSGGPKADPFLLPTRTWREVIGRLDDYGVFDVYVTGGESLMLDGFFDIAAEILGRGMGFGVSTNATVLPPRTLTRLRELGVGTVQVSLDGGTAATHELIRGAPRSFARTLAGIEQIAQFATPVINTVVNRMNLAELEQIVKVGVQVGCSRFKFFPQKPVGRSTVAHTLDDAQIMGTLVPECARLAELHQVEIETINPDEPCGSGTVGFAVDQRADIYPCIFGVENPAMRCGNLLTDNLDDVWFSSTTMAAFRGAVSTPCRRCEC